MWWFNKKSNSDIFRERIVSSYNDIFVQPPKVERIENPNGDVFSYLNINDQTFTPEFAEHCKKHYSQYINPKKYYIQFSFMAAPMGRTFESDTRIEVIDYSVCWGNCDWGYISNPKNHREYIPMKPVFKILCELMNETNKPYVVNVNVVKFNVHDWEQDNMLLTFSFIQNI